MCVVCVVCRGCVWCPCRVSDVGTHSSRSRRCSSVCRADNGAGPSYMRASS